MFSLMGPLLAVPDPRSNRCGRCVIALRPARLGRWVLPWARGLAILYTTRMAAWIPNLRLRRQFLAALHQLQNQ